MAVQQIPFIDLPLTFDRPALPRIPAAKIKPLYNIEIEADAIDEWHFGPDAASLVSVAGNTSTLTFADQPPGEYGSNYVDTRDTFSGHPFNGLIAAIPDRGVYTAWGVVERLNPTGTNRTLIYGNHNAGAAAGGSGLEWRADSLTGVVQSNQPLQTLAPLPPVGAKVFVAHVVDTANAKAFVYIGGQGKSAEQTITRLASTPTRNFALGNGYLSSSTAIAVPKLYEFGFKGYAATEGQLADLYARAVGRGVVRGYAVWAP